MGSPLNEPQFKVFPHLMLNFNDSLFVITLLNYV
jgi:hypothetical protein